MSERNLVMSFGLRKYKPRQAAVSVPFERLMNAGIARIGWRARSTIKTRLPDMGASGNGCC